MPVQDVCMRLGTGNERRAIGFRYTPCANCDFQKSYNNNISYSYTGNFFFKNNLQANSNNRNFTLWAKRYIGQCTAISSNC